jgi:hypothetical protein
MNEDSTNRRWSRRATALVAAHRHNADAFVYVLEGSIVMQVKGGKEAPKPYGCMGRLMRVSSRNTLNNA